MSYTGDEEKTLLQRYYPQSLAAGWKNIFQSGGAPIPPAAVTFVSHPRVLKACICSAAAVAAYYLVHAIFKSDSPKSTTGRCSWSVRKARLLSSIGGFH